MRIPAVLALLLSPSRQFTAQQAPAPPPPPNPKTLAQAALQRMIQADDAKTHFTRFDLEHTTNRNQKGKLTSQYTALYEDTWINALPISASSSGTARPSPAQI